MPPPAAREVACLRRSHAAGARNSISPSVAAGNISPYVAGETFEGSFVIGPVCRHTPAVNCQRLPGDVWTGIGREQRRPFEVIVV